MASENPVDLFDFVIVSAPRVGTHMLASALETSGLKCDKEVLNRKHYPKVKLQYGPWVTRFWMENLERYAENGARGFLVHRSHQGCPDFWKAVRSAAPRVKIVVPHRQDLLAMFVSFRLAKGGQNGNRWRDSHTSGLLRVEIAELLHFVRHYIKGLEFAMGLSRNLILCTYEDMLDGGHLKNVAESIAGNALDTVEPTTFKQEQRSLQEVIENYEDIRYFVEHFSIHL